MLGLSAAGVSALGTMAEMFEPHRVVDMSLFLIELDRHGLFIVGYLEIRDGREVPSEE